MERSSQPRRLGVATVLLAGLMLASPGAGAWGQSTARVYPGHVAAVRSLAFSPDGSLLLTGGDDGTVRLWEVASQRELKVSRPGGRTVDAVGFWRGGQGIVACGAERVMFYSLPDGRVLRSLPIGRKGSGGRILNPDVTRLIDAGNESLVMWNLHTGKQATSLDLRKRPGGKQIRCVAYSPEGRWVLVGCATWDPGNPGQPNQSALWQLDLKSRHLLRLRPPSGFSIDAVAWNGDVAAIGGLMDPQAVQGGWVNLVRDGKVTSFATLDYAVTCLAVNPEGTLVAVGSGDLQMWDVAGGAARESLGPRPTALSFGPPGSGLLAAGFEDGMVRVYRLAPRAVSPP